MADDLLKVAAINIDSLLSKTSDISKGVVYNTCQSLLKEWGPESLGVLPEDTIQQLLTGVIFYSFLIFPFIVTHPTICFISVLLKLNPVLIYIFRVYIC